MVTLHSILTFFKDSGIDKWLPIPISTLALVVSLFGNRQKKRDTQISLRKQLTELLEKLTDLNLERGKAQALNADLPKNYFGLLNDQRRFFVRQAAFLADRVETQVSPYEYRLLADGFSDIDDVFEAENYFKLGIQKTNNPFEKTIMLRGYARLLAIEGRWDEAEKTFKAALGHAVGNTDRHIFYRSECYERWAAVAAEFGNPNAERTLLYLAKRQARKYSNTKRCSRERARLNDLLKKTNPNARQKNECGLVKAE